MHPGRGPPEVIGKSPALPGEQRSGAPRVLVVDDDVSLLASLELALGRRGFEVTKASESDEAVRQIEQGAPIDLIVLDVMMPGMSGLTLCRLLRKYTSIPILMLSARDAVADKVEGLRSGADDYLPKPFDLDELVERLMALRRRGRENTRAVRRFADVVLDPATWTAARADQPLALTPTEFRLLAHLLSSPETVFPREELVRAIWGANSVETDSNTLEVHIANLRQKLEQGGRSRVVHTVRGIGYAMKG
jgi:two-component system response regulator MprA